MSSRIELTLTPCPAAGWLAGLPWLALAVTLAAALFPNASMAVAALPLAAGLRQYWRVGRLSGPSAVVGLSVRADQVEATLADGRVLPVDPAPDSRIGPWLVALKLRPSGTTLSRIPVVLLAPSRGCPGNVTAPDQLRRLRQWLRLGPRRTEQRPLFPDQEPS
ncbi:hypothetical protein [Marinobacter sp. C2H3]|uniref:hypothetical protein n=1 Tax=Marinobacter sp. C2H3 TaxID=3119003 RepID=UPI00300F358E